MLKGGCDGGNHTRGLGGGEGSRLCPAQEQKGSHMLKDKIWDCGADGKTVVYAWTPQPDITAYELALCMAKLCGLDSGSQGHPVHELPQEARRHFTQLG